MINTSKTAEAGSRFQLGKKKDKIFRKVASNMKLAIKFQVDPVNDDQQQQIMTAKPKAPTTNPYSTNLSFPLS